MTFERLSKLAHDNGFTFRTCGAYHWQIMSRRGFPLVNVWPSKNKYGKPIELHKYTQSIPMTSNVGDENSIIQFALEMQHVVPAGETP